MLTAEQAALITATSHKIQKERVAIGVEAAMLRIES
jgi:hypothetical protein